MTIEIVYVAGIAIAAIAAGVAATLLVVKRMARSSAKNIVEEARVEADILKKNKLLEIKEEEIKMKAEVEKQANARMSKLQSAEAKAKQREMQLNQQQSELQRKRNETDNLRAI